MPYQIPLALEKLNQWPVEEAETKVFNCCSSKNWAKGLVSKRPFGSFESLCKISDDIWFALEKQDWLEAFSHHPRIGANIESLRAKFQNTKTWSSQEQMGVNQASEETLIALQQSNLDYEKKFGHVFLICATGRSATEMLAALQTRIKNSSDVELKNAAVEQSKITHIRLEKLLAEINE